MIIKTTYPFIGAEKALDKRDESTRIEIDTDGREFMVNGMVEGAIIKAMRVYNLDAALTAERQIRDAVFARLHELKENRKHDGREVWDVGALVYPDTFAGGLAAAQAWHGNRAKQTPDVWEGELHAKSAEIIGQMARDDVTLHRDGCFRGWLSSEALAKLAAGEPRVTIRPIEPIGKPLNETPKLG